MINPVKSFLTHGPLTHGGTTLYELYSYVQPHRVWFCTVLV